MTLDDCNEKHKPLEKDIEKIHTFLFGDVTKSDEISFVSKVNIMFKDITSIKRWFLGSIIGVICFLISSSIFLGRQLQTIETNSASIRTYIENEKKLENRIYLLETKDKR